jgi:tetratricopeptide (TPR) repeat protein
MKKITHFLSLTIFAIVLFGCQSKTEETVEVEDEFNERIELSQLDSIRNELQKAMPEVPKDLYRKAIAMHLQFVDAHPKDDFAPVALDYAQGYYEQIQDVRSSITYINRILAEYPDYKGKQMLMFNKATHHDFLRDTTEARVAYEDYLKEYPNLSTEEKEEIRELIELVPYSIEERILMNSGK